MAPIAYMCQYVYTENIAKMFRQSLIEPMDANFERILWQSNPVSLPQHYRLRAVTYGLAPALYLAMRVLQQLAIDDGHLFPATVPIIENSIYVDDTLFGNDSLRELSAARDQLIGLMKGRGFQLRKWATNSPTLLDDISASQQELANHFLAKDETLKILGFSWLPQEVFCFVIAPSVTAASTRRSILSFVAKFYDPWGWAASVVITAKILLRRTLVAQERLGCPNPARISATMEGLCWRLAALGTCLCSALDWLEQGEFIVGSAWLCWCVKPRLCRCCVFKNHSFCI